jgi:hypothetical protein
MLVERGERLPYCGRDGLKRRNLVAAAWSKTMSVSKFRFLAFGLPIAGLGAAMAFGNIVPQLRGAGAPSAVGGTAENTAPQVADKQGGAKEPASGVRVRAPQAPVDVDKERGKVSVRAPHTDVHVDPAKGQVRVRAPYVNLDIRW